MTLLEKKAPRKEPRIISNKPKNTKFNGIFLLKEIPNNPIIMKHNFPTLKGIPGILNKKSSVETISKATGINKMFIKTFKKVLISKTRHSQIIVN